MSPEACSVDVTVIHFQYPDLVGCVEHCPYMHPHQSYCHVAGDGRPPDRTALELRIGSLAVQRGRQALFTETEQAAALVAIGAVLGNASAFERHQALTAVDRNGRTPLIVAGMLGDVPLLEVLWQHSDEGSPVRNAVGAYDAGGFSALMHAVQLGHTAAVVWLVEAGARLSPSDARILSDNGADIDGLLVAAIDPAPAYLGRGGFPWWHPSGEQFVETPLVGNTNPFPIR